MYSGLVNSDFSQLFCGKNYSHAKKMVMSYTVYCYSHQPSIIKQCIVTISNLYVCPCQQGYMDLDYAARYGMRMLPCDMYNAKKVYHRTKVHSSLSTT